MGSNCAMISGPTPAGSPQVIASRIKIRPRSLLRSRPPRRWGARYPVFRRQRIPENAGLPPWWPRHSRARLPPPASDCAHHRHARTTASVPAIVAPDTPRRRRPTRLRPETSLRSATIKYGGMSKLMRDRPLTIAPSPMRENWCSPQPPPKNTSSPDGPRGPQSSRYWPRPRGPPARNRARHECWPSRKHFSPMIVNPPVFVERFSVTNSRNTVPAPIRTPERVAGSNCRYCGAPPIVANGCTTTLRIEDRAGVEQHGRAARQAIADFDAGLDDRARTNRHVRAKSRLGGGGSRWGGSWLVSFRCGAGGVKGKVRAVWTSQADCRWMRASRPHRATLRPNRTPSGGRRPPRQQCIRGDSCLPPPFLPARKQIHLRILQRGRSS